MTTQHRGSPAEASPPGGAALRAIAVPAYGPTILASLGLGAALPVVVAAAVAVGADLATASLLMATFSLGPILADLPIGALVARVGERRALIGAALVMAAGFLAAARAPSVPALAAAIAVVGLSNATFGLARQAFVTAAVPVGLRARALSLLGGSHRVGTFVGPFAGAAVIGRWGTSAAFVLAAAGSVLAGVVVLATHDLPEESAREGAAPMSVGRVIRDHRRVLLRYGTGALLVALTRSARIAVVPLWAAHLGLDARATSLIVGVAGAVELILVYPAGALMDRRGRAAVAVPSMVGMAAGMALLPLAGGAVSLTAVSALLGVANGLSAGLVMTMAADVAPEGARAQFLGAFRLLADGGLALGPLVVSAVSAVATLGASALVVAALAGLGAGWLARALDPRSQPERRAAS